MQTLDSPMYEVNQESEYYKKSKARKDLQGRVNEILDEVASALGFDVTEFDYYSSGSFGFKWTTKAYDKFKDQLTKHSDRNGIHTFKKPTAGYKTISKMLKEIDEINKDKNPFALHDIFGINNLKASQWVEDRLFVGVKDAETTEKMLIREGRSKQYPVEPVKAMDYKEYLILVTKQLENL